MSDWDRISPYNYQYFAKQTSNEYKENIKQGIVCWSKRKFSKLTS